MLDLNENQRLSFLRRKGFKMISGSFMENDCHFKGGFQKDELWFPHDNEKIFEHNKIYGTIHKLASQEDFKRIKTYELFYISYKIKATIGDKFLRNALDKGYVEIDNPNFEKEGFDYLGIEEKEYEGQKYYQSHKGRTYKLFKNQNYGLIQGKQDFHYFTIYKL